MHIALTGSTGFLGSEFLRDLCLHPEVESITVLVADSTHMQAYSKIDALFQKWDIFGPRLTQNQKNKIKVCPQKLGFPYHPDSLKICLKTGFLWDYFVHCAGLTDLNPSIQVARRANLFGTQHALRLASLSPNLKKFVHISTAFVCGLQDHLIEEPESRKNHLKSFDSRVFSNHYERTKLEAENCVERSGYPYTIIRPSVIVGRSYDGYFPHTKVIYSLWKAWLRGIAPRIPVDPGSFVDIVPVDWVSKVIFELMLNQASRSEIFHACAAEGRQNNMELITLASEVFETDLPKTCPRKILDVLQWPIVQRFVPYDLQKLVSEFSPLLSYMNSKNRIFSMSKTNRLLEKNKLVLEPVGQWRANLFEFCKRTNWGKLAAAVPDS